MIDMDLFRRSLLLIISSLILISYCTGEEVADEKLPFPTAFLMKYLEFRLISRAVLLTNLPSGPFKLSVVEMEKLIRIASSSFIHLQILPFEDFSNSSASGSGLSLPSASSVTPSLLTIVIYDNSMEAISYLTKASAANHFRVSHKWLILTNNNTYESLETVFQGLDASVDCDVTIGVAESEGTVKRRMYKTIVGSWKLISSAEFGNIYKNVSKSSPVQDLGSLNLTETVGKEFQRSDFHALTLKVVTVNISSFYTLVLRDPVNQMPIIAGGYFGEVFNILSEAMNFTYSVNLLEGYAYGVLLSMTYNMPNWSGVVGELQHKHADVSGCEVSQLPLRHMVIDYSMPLQIISRRIYIHRPMRSGVGSSGSRSEGSWYKGGGFVRPFAMQVWLCITASLLLFLAAARLHAFYTFPKERDNRSSAIIKQAVFVKRKKKTEKTVVMKEGNQEVVGPPSLSSDFFRFTATLVQQGLPDDPDPDEIKGAVDSSQSRRLILWTASATYLIIYTSYGAKLASILASESEPQPPFTDLEGILYAEDWKLGFLDKGLGRVAFESAEPDTVMGKLWLERVKDDPSVLVPDVISGLRKALKGEYAFLGFHTGVQSKLVESLGAKESEEAELTKSEVCRLMALPNDYLRGGIAFGFQKDSPYKPVFDTWLLLIRSSGVLDRISRTWLPEALPCLDDQVVATVGLLDIAPAFSALAFGFALSTIILLLELLYDAYQKRPIHMRYMPPFRN